MFKVYLVSGNVETFVVELPTYKQAFRYACQLDQQYEDWQGPSQPYARIEWPETELERLSR